MGLRTCDQRDIRNTLPFILQAGSASASVLYNITSAFNRRIGKIKPMNKNDFKKEWCLLQNQFDSYEKHSLYIKLLSVIVLLTGEVAEIVSIFTPLVLGVLWAQDAIWKTFQSRIEPRLLQVEKCIASNSEESAFQFNSEYQKVCLTGFSLIGEYARQALRPTVAFPHVALILILVVQYLY